MNAGRRRLAMRARRHRRNGWRTAAAAVPVVAMLLAAIPAAGASTGGRGKESDGSPPSVAGRSIPLTRMARLDPDRFAAGIDALTGRERIRDRRWHALMALLEVLPPRARLPIVQHFFAGFPYRPDRPGPHGGDRWDSIAGFLETGGDCEEFAIARYRALRDSGIPADALRIVLARDRKTGADHAYLQVTLDGRTVVLDNRRDGLARPKEMTRYRPVALLNEKRLVLVADPGDARTVVGKAADAGTMPAAEP